MILTKLLMLSYLNIKLSEVTYEEVSNLMLSYDELKQKFKIDMYLEDEINKKIEQFKNKSDSLKEYGISYITFWDEAFPDVLKENGILFLLYKGNIDLLQSKLVGFVGTRECSEEACTNSEFYSMFLAQKGYVIVTGLARGIDAYATKGALKGNGSCIEVLPCPLDKITPKGNTNLLNEVIQNNGLAISTYFPGTRVYNSNYHDRNKIIALLSNSIIVGETKTTGGTISTMKYALQNNKQIYLLNYPKECPLFTEQTISLFKEKYKAIEISKLTP